MKLFIYRHDYNAFCGLGFGAPNGPRHQEVLVVASTRAEADRAVIRHYGSLRGSVSLSRLTLYTMVEWLNGVSGDRSFTVTEHEIQPGLVVVNPEVVENNTPRQESTGRP